MDSVTEQSPSKLRLRVVAGCLLAAVVALGVFALLTQRSIVNETARADDSTHLASVYQDARFWVGQEESLERKYRLEPSAEILHEHTQAERTVEADLKQVWALEATASAKRSTKRLLTVNDEYAEATRRMFAAVRAGDVKRVAYLDQVVTDPVFSTLQLTVYGRASAAAGRALSSSDRLKRDEASAFNAGLGALVLGLLLIGGLIATVTAEQRQRSHMRAAELRRLRSLATMDSLTGLRNHRAFQEDLSQELQRTGRSGLPLSLVILDADDLKAVNDAHGHQAGDELLERLASALTALPRGTDRAYRVGGDEFAVILHNAGEWAAFEFAQRVSRALAEDEDADGPHVRATAGIAQALTLRSRDDVIREASLALMNAKRFGQSVVIYTPEMQPFDEASSEAEEERHTRTLAKALALAVDSKDSYTRSHCQTVATLCSVIAAELGVEGARLKRIRLAGLLHDVGKIGIPDSILKKPAKLDPAEFEQMKTHSVLGESIVRAAEMPVEASWVRHHHERIDGRGYPDGLAGDEIPLEARIIHVADAFEAMTSDRPYRDAPGEAFAIEELARHSGTQFDPQVVRALLRVIGADAQAVSSRDDRTLAA